MQVQEKDQARKTHYRLAKLSLILFLILLFILILILNLHQFPYPSSSENYHFRSGCINSTYSATSSYELGKSNDFNTCAVCERKSKGGSVFVQLPKCRYIG